MNLKKVMKKWKLSIVNYFRRFRRSRRIESGSEETRQIIQLAAEGVSGEAQQTVQPATEDVSERARESERFIRCQQEENEVNQRETEENISEFR